LVPNPAEFGRNGRPPTHPQLVDWLAAEFMKPGKIESGGLRAESRNCGDLSLNSQPSTLNSASWSFRHLHRLILTSAAYRMSSANPAPNAEVSDPDNVWLWRMNPRRLEAEAVRDNLLHVTGSLDSTRGGPEIDQKQALTSRRRSLYLRHAAEKQAEFLQIFDGPSVTECYERRPSVMPQQALALGNSELAVKQARILAGKLSESGADDERFISQAFERILVRQPTAAELRQCREFLSSPIAVSTASAEKAAARARENLILVLLNHNDFVTVR
jgi:hypothetical protein